MLNEFVLVGLLFPPRLHHVLRGKRARVCAAAGHDAMENVELSVNYMLLVNY